MTAITDNERARSIRQWEEFFLSIGDAVKAREPFSETER
jgi:hypothetical protein